MPWKECHVVDERLRFVARLLDGEKMAPLCEEFGISRKTGYKAARVHAQTPAAPCVCECVMRKWQRGRPRA